MVQPMHASDVVQPDAIAGPNGADLDALASSMARQQAFLDILTRAGAPADAANATSIKIETALQLRGHCADFARGWSTATERAVDLLEATVLHYAVNGVPREIVRDGTVYHIREFSPALATFVLRSFRPAKYAALRGKMLPEVSPTMSRSDIIQRLKLLSRRIAAEDAMRTDHGDLGAA